ncbi:MAG: type IX secretion system sortase PorU [Bacteroidales bacterium]
MRKIEVFQAATFVLLFWVTCTMAQNSVLSEGDWYKISTSESGIHKISYNDLQNYGLDPSQINPAFIRLYGNGNGMLPEPVSEFRYDDLQELSIFVIGEEDEVFDPEDYILFYGESTTEWNFDSESGIFVHETNLYSDKVYYFLNVDTGPGKRINDQYSTILPYTYTSTLFDDYFSHEMEYENLLRSGKLWLGEKFEESTVYGFVINYPNLNINRPITLRANAVGRSSETSSMDFNINGNPELLLHFQSVSFSNPHGNFAYSNYHTSTFYVTNPQLSLEIEYNKPNDSSLAWLDYFSFNFKRDMIFDGPQMAFRDINTIGPDVNVSRFEIENATDSLLIWNITDPLNPLRVNYEFESGVASFILETDSLLEFIAFENDFFDSPEFLGQIPNQNLHGAEPPDMILISAPEFLAQANELANFRETIDGLDVLVTTPELIYNEFSSGSQDITAIRDFVKYVVDKATIDPPRFLLLFGDGSYDYLDRIENNTNYIPVWESFQSLNPVSSYCTDDYFAKLEGGNFIDISNGRLPVKTEAEANAVVQKIMNYSISIQSKGSWRNEICIIADDEDSNLHFSDAEEITEIIDTADHTYNIKKIYLDAYHQQINGNGQQIYPDVNEAITQKINDGVLLMSYIGHGGPYALAQEMVLAETNLSNWVNQDFYPFMVNITGEFSRLDDPGIISLGEKSFLIENKGMAAVFSPLRLTYAGANYSLIRRFYLSFLENPYQEIGELCRFAKNVGSAENNAKFILFGDPSMKLAVPHNTIETGMINGINIEEFADTIHPGGQLTLMGNILDSVGNTLNNFNGELFVKVFDRIKVVSTLGNDPQSIITEFKTQDSVIVEATSEVVNGEFEISFNLPADLDENIGSIKISYYANDGLTDARGFCSNILVGGQPSSVSNYIEEKFISVYPTLTSDFLHFKLLEETNNLQLDIYSITGEKVNHIEYNYLDRGEVGKVDVAGLPDGFYMVRITDGKKINHVKFVKK